MAVGGLPDPARPGQVCLPVQIQEPGGDLFRLEVQALAKDGDQLSPAVHLPHPGGRFQSPVVLGFVVGVDAGNAGCARAGVGLDSKALAVDGDGLHGVFLSGQKALLDLGAVWLPGRFPIREPSGEPPSGGRGVPAGSGSPAGGLGTVPPSGVPGQVLQEVCPGGLELLAVHAQPEEPAPEGVGGVVGDRAVRAGAGDRQGLVADREAQLDVGLDLPGVKGGVESPELDGALLPNGVEVQEVVPGGVVVLVCVPFPVPVVVPNPGELLGGGRLPAVQGGEEVGVDGLAPPFPAGGGNLQGLGQEVFLGVHQVDQVAQGAGGVAPQPDVHVDAAGGVGVCPRRPERPDAGLHRFEVFPAAHRGDELCALVPGSGDAPVGNALPAAAFPVDDDPSVVGTAFVPHLGGVPVGGKNPGDRPGGGLAGNPVDLDLGSEGLGFHGVGSFLPAAAFPARPGCRAVPFGRFPARRTHPSLRRAKKSTVFFRKKSRPLPYTCVKPAGKKPKKPGFFSPARAHRRPETRPPETGKTRPETPPEDPARNRPGTPAGVGTRRPGTPPARKTRRPPPGGTARPGTPSRGLRPAAARPGCAQGGGGQIP